MTEVSPLLPDFDSLWDFDNPAESEQRFRLLLKDLEASGDLPAQAELLTQIARALGLQRRFEDAQQVLNVVDGILDSVDAPRAAVRLVLEQGRVFNSQGLKDDARPFFEKAYEMALEADEDFYAVDAAHMMAIVETGYESLAWNHKAIEIAKGSRFLRTREWLGSLLNNTGWAYHDLGNFISALSTFRQVLAWQQAHGTEQDIRIAQWCVARTLRSLGEIDEALTMQQALLSVYGGEDPNGYTEEEIGECLLALDRSAEAQPYFARAYTVLSNDPWLAANEPARLERLRALSTAE